MIEDKKNMTYQELVRGYRAKGYKLKYYGKVGKCSLYKIVINPRYKKTLFIDTGFHGEEFNGPICLLELIDRLSAFATKKRARVITYIAVNPEGFDRRERYNGRPGEKYNNDFMRYVIKGGKRVGTLRKGEAFSATVMGPSPAREVRLLQKDIQKYFFPVPDAVLDIHQQKGDLKNGDVFAFIFDRPGTYRRIMKKLEKIAPIARNDSWTDVEDGRKIRKRIDQDGFVFIHDGSITDMFYRHGSKFVVTSETETTLTLEQVTEINLIWAKELIKLITKKPRKNRKRKKK